MRTILTLTALALTGLSLSACDKTPSVPPLPEVRSVTIDSSAAPASTPESWLPPADSASAPKPVATLPPTGERSNRASTRELESSSTPIAGQNNDHSAPLTPAKPASSP